jgi:hypothetical protein
MRFTTHECVSIVARHSLLTDARVTIEQVKDEESGE